MNMPDITEMVTERLSNSNYPEHFDITERIFDAISFAETYCGNGSFPCTGELHESSGQESTSRETARFAYNGGQATFLSNENHLSGHLPRLRSTYENPILSESTQTKESVRCTNQMFGESSNLRSFSEDSFSKDINDCRRWLSFLTKNQLVYLVSKACMMNNDIFDLFLNAVSSSPSLRRLMVRNINFQTTDEDFYRVMRSFGETEDCSVVRDRDTGKSKGYGFVTFKHVDTARKVLEMNSCNIVLDNKILLIKLALDPSANDCSNKHKLFVRNLSCATTNETLYQAFSQFGKVTECIVISSGPNKSKGYGFVSFERSEDAFRASLQNIQIIDGRLAFVDFATHHGINAPNISSPVYSVNGTSKDLSVCSHDHMVAHQTNVEKFVPEQYYETIRHKSRIERYYDDQDHLMYEKPFSFTPSEHSNDDDVPFFPRVATAAINRRFMRHN